MTWEMRSVATPSIVSVDDNVCGRINGTFSLQKTFGIRIEGICKGLKLLARQNS
jgi:hypothetical protein